MNKLDSTADIHKRRVVAAMQGFYKGREKPKQSRCVDTAKNLLEKKEFIMNGQTNEQEMTLDILAEKYPDLHSQLVEMARLDGEKSTRELFGRFVEKFSDDPAFIIEHFGKGATIEQADAAWLEKLKAEFQQSPNLQAEFGGRLDDYLAFVKAKFAGRIG
jgi:hypothetical protein